MGEGLHEKAREAEAYAAWAAGAGYGTAMERAVRGAELLDKIAPGWFDRVELRRLDVASSCRCVLGQVYGPGEGEDLGRRHGFGVGLDAVCRATVGEAVAREDFRAERTTAKRYGFDAGCEDVKADFEELQRAWEVVITARQGRVRLDARRRSRPRG